MDQYFILKHPQSVILPEDDTKFHTHVKQVKVLYSSVYYDLQFSDRRGKTKDLEMNGNKTPPHLICYKFLRECNFDVLSLPNI
jgi:hypothetical protein